MERRNGSKLERLGGGFVSQLSVGARVPLNEEVLARFTECTVARRTPLRRCAAAAPALTFAFAGVALSYAVSQGCAQHAGGRESERGMATPPVAVSQGTLGRYIRRHSAKVNAAAAAAAVAAAAAGYGSRVRSVRRVRFPPAVV